MALLDKAGFFAAHIIQGTDRIEVYRHGEHIDTIEIDYREGFTVGDVMRIADRIEAYGRDGLTIKID
uniref:Uncharacterized protein n=1 Tax=viral metagenome TaxID=1070528 RepID=A0A6M3LDU3_9ZZZZ